jgi:hypothetical protein
MPKASEIAAELRGLAESIAMIDDSVNLPYVFVNIRHNSKESFLAFAKNAMPRPFATSTEHNYGQEYDLRLTHETDNVHVWCAVNQSLTCTLVEPAKPAVYKCDPILSEEEYDLVESN